ncbi:hypothetical protein mRhiFer1_009794 [Rhinolophus ferrumequinum]|uniref:Uncharacterized protein n=1 Tax=Rhinolophus ferrumequinum TaxID=59479 RepID=A0A7J7ZCS0_RHIFE|nr:hypothetical protein mRhiFer1_009794 [Rhinolophus ferrumequinum]
MEILCLGDLPLIMAFKPPTVLCTPTSWPYVGGCQIKNRPCWYLSHGSPENTEPIGYTDKQKELRDRNWLTGLWRPRSPTSTVCKRAGQEVNGVVLVQAQRPENQKHQRLRAGEDGCSSSSRKSMRFLPFLFYSGAPTV